MRYVVLLIMLFCAGCSSGTDLSENVSVEVVFCPQEDCLGAFLNLTLSVSSLDCALFDLDHPEIISRLQEKNARVVIDGDNLDEVGDFTVRYDDRGQYMHNKFCIINGSTVWTGSMNPTHNGIEKNDNNNVIVSSKRIASAYSEEFSELWRGVHGSGSTGSMSSGNVSVLFCPEDNCKGDVLSLLESAQDSIHFMTFSFTDRDIAALLIAKHSAGVSVQGIMEKRRLNMKYNVYDQLVEGGVSVVGDGNPAVLHHKVFVVDEHVVVTGSYNPTKSGNERNDENLVVIKDSEVARRYVETFEYLNQSAMSGP